MNQFHFLFLCIYTVICNPFLFAIMVDSLTENIRKEAHWQMMFADDVVLCAREKDVLELELEQWREALEKRGMKVSRAKTSGTHYNSCGRTLCAHTPQDNQGQCQSAS